MQRITALWNSNWMGKAIIGGVGLLIACCVLGALTNRGGRQQPLAGAPDGPTVVAGSVVTAAPGPPPPPESTSAPRATAAPKPTQTLVPTFTPVPTLTPNPNLDPAGVAPLNKTTCPPDYLVKGNDGNNGKIYHTPGSSSYKQTNPERCFATAADARAAGFSAPAN